MNEIRVLSSADDSMITAKEDKVDPIIFPDVIMTTTGSIKLVSTLPNFESLMNAYGITIRYNAISKEAEILLPWSEQTDLNYVGAEIISQCNMNGFPKGDVPQYIGAVATKNQYNPIKAWLNIREWDGVDRFNEVANLIHVPFDYEEAKIIYLKRWCFSAIGMLENDGNMGNEGVLVFQGDQGLGKTRWIKSLIGEMHQYFKDGLIVDPHSKDSVATAISHWIVEIGELDATFKKSDLAALKGFFTSTKDRFRRPFDRYDSVFPRTTVFFASVNDQQFLKDTTGDRRYWCLPVKELSIPENYNAQQFWAQIKYMMNEEINNTKNDFIWYLNEEEIKIRDGLNEDFRESNPIEEAITRRFPLDGDKYYITSTDVANILEIQANQANISQIGRVLKQIYGEPKRTAKLRYYMVPLPTNWNMQTIALYNFKKVN